MKDIVINIILIKIQKEINFLFLLTDKSKPCWQERGGGIPKHYLVGWELHGAILG